MDLTLLLLLTIICVAVGSLSNKQLRPEILSLGNNLTEVLRNPADSDITVIKNDVNKYLNLLSAVYTLMYSKSGRDVTQGMAVFDDLEDLEGPPHVNLTLSYKAAEKELQSTDVDGINSVLNVTRELWNKMVDRANRLRNGIPDSAIYADSEPEGKDEEEGELH